MGPGRPRGPGAGGRQDTAPDAAGAVRRACPPADRVRQVPRRRRRRPGGLRRRPLLPEQAAVHEGAGRVRRPARDLSAERMGQDRQRPDRPHQGPAGADQPDGRAGARPAGRGPAQLPQPEQGLLHRPQVRRGGAPQGPARQPAGQGRGLLALAAGADQLAAPARPGIRPEGAAGAESSPSTSARRSSAGPTRSRTTARTATPRPPCRRRYRTTAPTSSTPTCRSRRPRTRRRRAWTPACSARAAPSAP